MLRAMLNGAGAGVVATLAMSGFMALAKAVGVLGEPPPKKLTRKIFAGLVPRRGPSLDLAAWAAHLGFGAACGVTYSLLPTRAHGVVSGSLFGVSVWSASYVVALPKLGLMPSPSRDRRGRPTAMALAHVVFGATLGMAMRRLAKPSSEASPARVAAEILRRHVGEPSPHAEASDEVHAGTAG